MSRNFEILRKVHSEEPVDVDILPASVDGRPEEVTWAAAPPQVQEPSEWHRLLVGMRRNWLLAAAVALLIFGAVAAYTYSVKPIYEPKASIEIDPPGAQDFSLREAGGTPIDSDYVETQGRNLESDELAIKVIRQLKLDQLPEFGSKSEHASASASQNTADSQRLTPAENLALTVFRSKLHVARENGTRLFSVSFASHDPVLAANVANTVAKDFIESSFRKRHDAIVESSQWLSRQLDDVRQRMDDSNKALLAFQTQSGIAGLAEDKNTYTERMSDLEHQIAQAQADRIQLEAYVHQIRAGESDQLPQFQTSTVVQGLTQKIAELQGELSQAQVIYGPKHPNTQRLKTQIEELQKQLALQRNAITSELKTSYAAARKREQLLSGQVSGANVQLSQAAHYLALKKEAQTNTDLYNTLYGRIKEAAIAAGAGANNIKVMDEARILNRPTWPNRKRNLALGLLGGIFMGLLLAGFKDLLSSNLTSVDDVKRWAGLSAVTVVPQFGAANGHRAGTGLRRLMGGALELSDRVVLDRPQSPEAEAIRGLETSVMLSNRERPPQMVLVSSSLPGEGKTTVAMNLAMALSKRGPTCLIDADLRRPALRNKLGALEQKGLANLLRGEAPLEEVLQPVPGADQLSLLAAGTDSVSATTLLSSEKMVSVLRRLRTIYRFVIIDTAPLIAYCEARALSPHVDGVVFVGRAGATPRPAFQRSLELLAEVHSAPIISVVVNAAGAETPAYYKYGYRYNEA